MKIEEKKLREILLTEDYISEKDLTKVDEYKKTHRSSFVDILLSQELITKNLLGQAIAEYYKLPYVDLSSNPAPEEFIKKIPEDIGKQLRVIYFNENEKDILITTDNPEQKNLLKSLKKIFPDKKIFLGYSSSEDIDANFIHYIQPLETRFSQIIKEQKFVAPEILKEIFDDAISLHASDIHFEPQEKVVIVRFRVDGVLREAGQIPREYYDNILNKIKVMAHLRIDDHFSAQDGSLGYKREEDTYDMRLSIIPTIDGEKIVIRLLSKYINELTLGNLGLNETDQEIIAKSVKKPFGMVLVTGPTGSGKSTTLYALIRVINRSEVNITTIEDPVEYKVAGINQIQVNLQTNLSFAKGLKSIVRQDPDIILVGEIRDEETAEIAVNAALTGHLLFSTFHANDAATAIPRLLDMGIEPFLLSSTLDIIVAQRLTRKICEKCKYTVNVTKKELEKYGPEIGKYFSGKKAITLYKGRGCENCKKSGYKGRTAIFEIIKVTPELQNLILTNPSTQQISKLARQQGTKSLFEDGIDKVKRGITTIEEVLRVAEIPK